MAQLRVRSTGHTGDVPGPVEVQPTRTTTISLKGAILPKPNKPHRHVAAVPPTFVNLWYHHPLWLPRGQVVCVGSTVINRHQRVIDLIVGKNLSPCFPPILSHADEKHSCCLSLVTWRLAHISNLNRHRTTSESMTSHTA